MIVTGVNSRHIKTISSEISMELKKKKLLPISTEGVSQAWWVLLDYGTVVVHVFSDEARTFYDLENLWGDAEGLDWESLESRMTGS